MRCSACGHAWFQAPIAHAQSDLILSVAEQYSKVNSMLGSKLKPDPALTAEPHARLRKKVHDKIQLGNRLAAGLPWGIAALILIVGSVGAVVNRNDIVRAWPKSSSVFAAIGQPANLYGIEIGRIQARISLDAKGSRINVAGVLTSVSRISQPVPYLKVSLVNAAGVEKLSWMVDPDVDVLAPGQSHMFVSGRANPLPGNLKIVVVFAEPPLKAARPLPTPEPPTGTSGLMGAKSPSSPLKSAQKPVQMPDPVTAR